MFAPFIPQSGIQGVERYIPFVLIAIILLFLARYLGKLLRTIGAFFLSPLRRMRANYEETARTKAEKKSVMKKVKRLLENKDYKPAATLLESINELEEAANYYMQAGEQISAAGIYESLGDLEKAATLYREAGNNTRAGDIFLRLGDYRNAALMYENCGLFKKAAGIYEEGRDIRKAAELYEVCFIEDAARGNSSALENALKSGKLFEATGSHDQALRVYLKAGLHEEAAHVYEMTRDFINAGEAYLNAGSLEKAAGCFAEGGDDRRSNEILSKLSYQKGLLSEAASYAEKAGDPVQAAEMCVEAGDFPRAGELYASAGWHHEAGEMFLRVDDALRAADAFEKAGNFVLAARTYQKAGVTTLKVAELFEKGGEYFEAGNLYLRYDLPEKALNAYQMVDPGSESYMPASLLIGEIFLKKGMLKLAFEKFRKIIGNDPVNKSNIDAYYHLGLCLESAGATEKAKAVYGKVLSENFNFRDVRQRIEQLSKAPPGKQSG